MDFMILGETIRATSATTAKYEGFWMPRGGDEATGAIDVVHLSTSDAFTVEMETKETEQADSAATSIGSASISGTGITKFDCTGAKELVRYIVKKADIADPEYMHFQLLPPQWNPN